MYYEVKGKISSALVQFNEIWRTWKKENNNSNSLSKLYCLSSSDL